MRWGRYVDPMTRLALFLLLLGSPIAALAQDDVGSVAWLSGCWVASAGDVLSEEVWMEPEGGLMVGMARTLRGGVATGYEFLLLQRKDGASHTRPIPPGRTRRTSRPPRYRHRGCASRTHNTISRGR